MSSVILVVCLFNCGVPVSCSFYAEVVGLGRLCSFSVFFAILVSFYYIFSFFYSVSLSISLVSGFNFNLGASVISYITLFTLPLLFLSVNIFLLY